MLRTLIILILSLFSSIIFAQDKTVIIEGQILGYNSEKPIYYSISDSYGGMNRSTIMPDSLGKFVIKKEIDELSFFTFTCRSNGKSHSCRLILNPGSHYSFISEGLDSILRADNWTMSYTPDIYNLNISGDINTSFYKLDRAQMYYNLIDNGTMGALYNDEWDLTKPDSLIPVLKSKINGQLQVFKDLLEKGDIDESFYEIAKLNIEYTQAYRLAATIRATWGYEQYAIDDSTVRKKLLEIYPLIFEMYPVNKNIKFEHHFCYDRYIDIYLEYLDSFKNYGRFVRSSKYGPESYHKNLRSKEHLSEKAYKNYHISRLMSYGLSLGIDTKQLAKKFLEENPEMKDEESAYMLENIIIPGVDSFYAYTDKKTPEFITIIEEKDSITSFSELVKLMNGRAFIIDIWGSWCLPCRYQFQHIDSIKPFLRTNNIEIVYIAFEYGNTLLQWKNLIKAHGLQGLHFVSNNRFREDLEKHTGTIEKVPTYIIVNSLGEVVEPDAYGPGERDKLINQLKKVLKL
ncbi:MAG: thioredoxin-like domain-containing protein [Bacteroidales bacterium]